MKSRIGILIIIFTSYIIGHGQQQAVPIWEYNSHINALPFLVQEIKMENKKVKNFSYMTLLILGSWMLFGQMQKVSLLSLVLQLTLCF